MPVRFFAEDIRFNLEKPRKISRWISSVVDAEKHAISELNFIFCSDRYLLGLNQDYLQHETLTDVITFDLGSTQGVLTGDIFISIPRVRENAGKYGFSFPIELCRVMVHGVLHLMGYSDNSAKAKKAMRKKEDAYLSLLRL